jgi:hypothetical protein
LPPENKFFSQLSIEYRANNKAWITSILFDKWLKKFDKRMKAENRNVALIIDNCSAHSIGREALNNVSI